MHCCYATVGIATTSQRVDGKLDVRSSCQTGSLCENSHYCLSIHLRLAVTKILPNFLDTKEIGLDVLPFILQTHLFVRISCRLDLTRTHSCLFGDNLLAPIQDSSSGILSRSPVIASL